MTARSLCFAVPAVPMSLNAWRREHWHVARRESRKWDALIEHHAAGAEPIPGPVRVALTFTVTTRRKFDPDNHAKNVLDALVSAGLIEDDGAPLMVQLTLAARLGSRASTEITITEADAPAWQAAPRRARKKKQAA